MARRVFLHVGPPKTGTSYLQGVWWHNRHRMADHGLLYPGSQWMDHFHAAAVVCENDRLTRRMTRPQLRLWDRLLEEIGEFPGDALLSSERFAAASPAQAEDAVTRLAAVAEEVHVLVTARDLARQVPSSWQQFIKRGGAQTLEEWWRLVADDESHAFWRYHDVAGILDRWCRGLPPQRAHVIVHAKRGAPSGLLLERVCGVVGLDPSVLEPVGRGNESLGSTHVELLRRINARLPEDRDRLEMGRMTKDFFARRVLIPAGDSDGFVLPPEAHAWAAERGHTMVEQLRARDYEVAGSLDDLVPDPDPRAGRSHLDVTDSEIAELASSALARMLVHEWDMRKEHDTLRRTVRRQRRELRKLRDRAPVESRSRPVRSAVAVGRRLLARRSRAVSKG